MFNQNIVIGRRVIELAKLQYFILPGKFGNFVNRAVYAKMFEFWKKQWEPVTKSVTGVSQLDSDEFLRQFEITALLYEGDVVGLLCLDLFDLDSLIHLKHSYFSWLKHEDYTIFKDFGVSLVINQLAVSKLWRGEFGIADLLVGLAVKRMQISSFQRTICYTRNFRRTDSLAERWGARPILEGQIVHSEPSTYFEFPKSSFKDVSHSLKPVVDVLWNQAKSSNRLIINNLIINNEITKEDKYENEINQ